MNVLYTLTWHNTGAEEEAGNVYLKLRDAVARGSRIPFDCPYEIGQARERSSESGEWVVAAMVLHGPSQAGTERGETVQRLEAWFIQAGAEDARGGQARPADHLKLASELGPGYEIIDSFGTFVGEPDAASAGKPLKPADEEPVKVEPEKPLAATPEPEIGAARMAQELARPLITPPPPTPTGTGASNRPVVSTPPTGSSAAQASSASGCASIVLIILGGLIAFSGAGLALLLAIGAYADPTAETSLTDFLLMMACFPLPLVISGLAILAVGIFVLRRTKTKPL